MEAQEVFAFALILYAETHLDFLTPAYREKVNATVSNLSDSLDGLDSSIGAWCREWLGGKQTLILHPEYLQSQYRGIFELTDGHA